MHACRARELLHVGAHFSHVELYIWGVYTSPSRRFEHCGGLLTAPILVQVKAVFWVLAVATAILLLNAPNVAADVAAPDVAAAGTDLADDIPATDIDPADIAPKRPPSVGNCQAGCPCLL